MTDGIIQKVLRKYKRYYRNTGVPSLNQLEQELIEEIKNYFTIELELDYDTATHIVKQLIGDNQE